MSARQVPSWPTPARQVRLLQLLARAWHHCCHCFSAQNHQRQRGDSNPCGQSPMDFGSISLAARTHCHALVRICWLAIYYFRYWEGPNLPAAASWLELERENSSIKENIPRPGIESGQAEILTTLLPQNPHFASCVQHFGVQKDASEHCSEYCLFFCPAVKNLPRPGIEPGTFSFSLTLSKLSCDTA